MRGCMQGKNAGGILRAGCDAGDGCGMIAGDECGIDVGDECGKRIQ
jgi:hypothetical protein